MTTRMLIDARHHEETRVAVLKGNRIEEFDFESADHKQIKGNIYLAKVTRVEPSLQAAFVDFGGNRHGFLAFSEIHPDYYQIPKEDREALLAEEAAHAAEEAALRAAEDDDDDDASYEGGDDGYDDEHDESSEALVGDLAGDDEGVTEIDTSEKDDVATIEDGHVDDAGDGADDHAEDEAQAEGEQPRGRGRGRRQSGGGRTGGQSGGQSGGGRGQAKSSRGQADELRDKRMALRRRYKIQDVIQRRQVLLVQVVKEERGNKGAALTTYLSLAGRYCVLMPNSSHGGGISRKISSAADRKRLKSVVSDLDLPKSMGCIVRTAGLSRTKTEIKRDFDYLARLWDEIRENTLGSSAPALIHSDSDLIKRAIRDIYNRDIEEVVIEGEAGYRAGREFMKLLMPSHARRVKQYADPVPLYQRYGAEDQLTAMYDPVVQLKSGGYLVINPTEALVSIDVNSGRSTKEHGIEATALNTNLEAAREVARQLRLRDMAGLVVIDFIDMEYSGSNRKVEKAMKDALKNDRARIQIGRISSFGLMEMSRQRLRTGVLEATTRGCPHCDGTGLVRTAGSAGLSALRLIEDEAAKGKGNVISLFASTEAAVYLLNAKRTDLGEIEGRYGVRVEVLPEGENEGAKMRVASSGPRPEFVPTFETITFAEEDDDDLPFEDDEDEVAETEARDDSGDDERSEGGREGRSERGERGGRKRRRGGRGRDRDEGDRGDRPAPEPRAEGEAAEGGEDGDETSDNNAERGERSFAGVAEGDGEGPRKRRRRGRRRRGGRGRDGEGEGGENGVEGETGEAGDAAEGDSAEGDDAPLMSDAAEQPAADEAEAKPKPRSRRRKAEAPEAETVSAALPEAEAPAAEAPAKPVRKSRKKVAPEAELAAVPAPEMAAEPAAEAEAVPASNADEAPVKPVRKSRKKAGTEPAAEAPASAAAEAEPEAEAGPPRSGWWQRTFGA